MDEKYGFGAYSKMTNRCNSCVKRDVCDKKEMELCGYLYSLETNIKVENDINLNNENLHNEIIKQLNCNLKNY